MVQRPETKANLIFAKVRSSFLSFVSGIFLATSINLLTGLLTVDVLPHRWRSLVLASILFLASSILFYVMTPTIEDAHALWRLADKRPEAWPHIISPHVRFLTASLAIGVLAAAGAFTVLATGFLGR